MEGMLEAELAKLGVPVADFVARLQASPPNRSLTLTPTPTPTPNNHPGTSPWTLTRRQASPECRAASELVETVLAMDDFVSFKGMMIKLRADLERAMRPIEDFNVRFARPHTEI
jgi:hypothetical protein